jgi:hypothetical protein
MKPLNLDPTVNYLTQAPATVDVPEWRKSLSAFGKETKALGAGLTALGAQATGFEGTRDRALANYQRNMEEAQSGWRAPEVGRIEDIQLGEEGGLGRATSWASYQLPKGLATLGTMLLGGGVGGALAKAGAKKEVKQLAKSAVAGMAEDLAKKKAGQVVAARTGQELAEFQAGKVAAQQLSKQQLRGAQAGALGTAFGMETGQTYGQFANDPEIGPEKAVGPALAYGGISAALEYLPIHAGAKAVGLDKVLLRKVIKADPGLAEKAVELSARQKALRFGGKVGGTALAGAGTEGFTEGLQSLAQQAAERYAKEDPNWAHLLPKTEEGWSDYWNSTAAGALIGLAGGAAVGPFTGGQNATTTKQPEPGAEEAGEVALPDAPTGASDAAQPGGGGTAAEPAGAAVSPVEELRVVGLQYLQKANSDFAEAARLAGVDGRVDVAKLLTAAKPRAEEMFPELFQGTGEAAAPQPQAEAPAPDAPQADQGAEPTAQTSSLADQLLADVDSGSGVPAFISNRMRAAAAEVGVNITGSMTPNDVIDVIRARRGDQVSDTTPPQQVAEPTAPPQPSLKEQLAAAQTELEGLKASGAPVDDIGVAAGKVDKLKRLANPSLTDLGMPSPDAGLTPELSAEELQAAADNSRVSQDPELDLVNALFDGGTFQRKADATKALKEKQKTAMQRLMQGDQSVADFDLLEEGGQDQGTVERARRGEVESDTTPPQAAPLESRETRVADRLDPLDRALSPLDTQVPQDNNYVYHATNAENAADIRESGRLDVFDPDYGTEQNAWPDGATTPRSYWNAEASSVGSFAPAEGQPVILRAKKGDAYKREGTGDLYLEEQLPASELEILTDRGWEPLQQQESVPELDSTGQPSPDSPNILESRTTAPVHTTVDFVASTDSVLGQGWTQRALDAGILRVNETSAEGSASGTYDQQTGALTINLDRTPKGQSVVDVVLHEGSHAGMERMLGKQFAAFHADLERLAAQGSPTARRALADSAAGVVSAINAQRAKDDQIQHQLDTLKGQALAEEIGRVRDLLKQTYAGLLREEDMAYYVQRASAEGVQEQGFWNRLRTAIAAWFAQTDFGKALAGIGWRPEMSPQLAVALAQRAAQQTLQRAELVEKLVGEKARVLRGLPAGARVGVLESFAGAKAKIANTKLLDVAKHLMDKGVPPYKIWKDTGWFQNADGRWRFEIDASKMRVINPTATTLGEAIYYPALFDAYPELRTAPVKRTEEHSFYSPLDREINISRQPQEVRLDFLHEIQHAIQAIEGTSAGANNNAVGWARYFRDLGEVEARNVEARSSLTASERRRIDPLSTQDIPSRQAFTSGEWSSVAGPNPRIHGPTALIKGALAKNTVNSNLQSVYRRYGINPIEAYTDFKDNIAVPYFKSLGFALDEGKTLRLRKWGTPAIEENYIDPKSFSKGSKAAISWRILNELSLDANAGGWEIGHTLESRPMEVLESRASPLADPTSYWRSGTAEAVAEATQKKAAPQQWLGWLKKQPRVKQEELDDLGLEDWLEAQNGSVTKEQVLAFVQGGGVRVRERLYNFQEGDDLGEAYPDEDVPGTRYAANTLPGGENYRELVMTIPSTQRNLTDAEVAEYNKLKPRELDGQLTPEEQARIEELRTIGNAPRTDYTSSHWPEPNPLLHIRFDERTAADGSRVLFVQEVQSDLQQDYKKKSATLRERLDKDFNSVVAELKASGDLVVECD